MFCLCCSPIYPQKCFRSHRRDWTLSGSEIQHSQDFTMGGMYLSLCLASFHLLIQSALPILTLPRHVCLLGRAGPSPLCGLSAAAASGRGSPARCGQAPAAATSPVERRLTVRGLQYLLLCGWSLWCPGPSCPVTWNLPDQWDGTLCPLHGQEDS